MNLSDREKDLIKGHIDRGEPLPPKYRLSLFADAPEVELIWQGKTSEVTSVVLPFQSIEQIDEPRKETSGAAAQTGLFTVDGAGRQSGGWSNKLIWGDNKLILSSLKNGPMRRAIEDAGGLKLVYIDPPFDKGLDFSFEVEVGDDETVLKREQSVIEELTFRDTWGRGNDSYLAMIYERAQLIHGLLAPDGAIFVHCDWRLSHDIRCVLDLVFGRKRFLNELVWVYGESARGAKAIAAQFARNHDSIYWYAKSADWTFKGDHVLRVFSHDAAKKNQFKQNPDGSWFKTAPRGDYTDESIAKFEKEGRIFRTNTGSIRIKYALDSKDGQVIERVPVGDSWMDIPDAMHLGDEEQTNYSTQKPEALLRRVISACSEPGDLVADFFCGSGTTLAVAEKLGRKWIGCDLGRFAIHTTRKRLIGVQRQLKTEGKAYRAFEILNLGKYERQWFVGIDPTLPAAQREAMAAQKEAEYLDLILRAYKGERVLQMPPFHGKKGAVLVVVGPIDAPVTQGHVQEIIAHCQANGIKKVDVLAFEFEMGLVPQCQEDAKARGIALAPKWIPKDVFDKRAVDKGQVKFYDVAFVEVKPIVTDATKTKKATLSVKLEEFGVYYEQGGRGVGGKRGGEIEEDLKPGGSRVAVEGGQVVKISKDKKTLAVAREVLTKKWTDWIDYWAVDFDYQSRPEIIRVVEKGKDGAEAEREVATGGFIFENEWQSFRTRKDRTLELTSAPREYERPGKYKVAVKVIDIFGNDTTKVIEVRV